MAAEGAGRGWWWLGLGLLLAVIAAAGLFRARWYLVRLSPTVHSGVVERVGSFHKNRAVVPWGTEQGFQFTVVFRDGFNCEANDPAFATVRAGDTIEMFGYPDVFGWPIVDPEWWQCGEGQLTHVAPAGQAP